MSLTYPYPPCSWRCTDNPICCSGSVLSSGSCRCTHRSHSPLRLGTWGSLPSGWRCPSGGSWSASGRLTCWCRPCRSRRSGCSGSGSASCCGCSPETGHCNHPSGSLSGSRTWGPRPSSDATCCAGSFLPSWQNLFPCTWAQRSGNAHDSSYLCRHWSHIQGLIRISWSILYSLLWPWVYPESCHAPSGRPGGEGGGGAARGGRGVILRQPWGGPPAFQGADLYGIGLDATNGIIPETSFGLQLLLSTSPPSLW